MSFKNNLLNQEEVLWDFAPHWIVFLRSFSWFALTLVVLLMGPFYSFTRFHILQGPSVYQYAAGISFAVAFYYVLKSFLVFSTSRLIISNKRLFVLRGFFRQSVVEMNLTHIRTIELSQSLLGKALNYGDLRIGSKSNRLKFDHLAYPQWVRSLLLEMLEKQESLPFLKKNASAGKPLLYLSEATNEFAEKTS